VPPTLHRSIVIDELHTYGLMLNRVYLIIETPAANLSKAMRSSTLSQPFDLRPCANHIQRNVVTCRATWSTTA
jgi:hypothetical protein